MIITRGRVAAVAGIVVAAAVATVLGIVLSFGRSDRICRGVTISGVDVGGMTRTDAGKMMQSWARERLDQRIVLTALDSRFGGMLADFGARVAWQEAVDRAYTVGRKGSIIERAVCVLSLGGTGKRITADVIFDQARLRKTIIKAARAVNRPHKNAKMRVVGGRLEVQQDINGIKLDEEKAVAVVSAEVGAGRSLVRLPIDIDRPKVTASDASGIDTLLSSYTTSFNAGKRDRTHNLKLAAEQIDGVILKPGDVFSYNDTVGPRVHERGYRDATIFVKGRQEPGLGGGICQVSSTLYNAVLLAGLKVRERSPHSRTVPYVVPGRDATVAYGIRDFRFENSNSSAICLITKMSSSKLTVDIYGSAKDKQNISIFTSKPQYTPVPGTQTVVDRSLKPGEKKVIEEGARGVSVVVYRKVVQPDGSARTEVVSRDKYPAQKALIAVGDSAPTANITAVPASVASSAGSGTRTE